MLNLLKDELLDKVREKFKEYGRWLVLIHENPDGDTLGCGLALYSLGLRLGKDVRILGKSCLPDNYRFFPLSEHYEQKLALTAGDVPDGTLVICVDTSTIERSVDGLRSFIGGDNSINIDHHGDNQLYAGLNVVIEEASATAEIITDLLGYFGIEKNEAVCLYASLVTDNGSFKFKSTTPLSHLCAAKLLEAGADPSELDDLINQNMTREIMTLWGNAFCRVELFAGGEAAMFWLDKSDLEKANAGPSSVDGLVNNLMRIRGVKIGVLLMEIDEQPKLSVRTRAPYSARDIAAVWGGGGHVQAAGAKIDVSFEEAKKTVKDRVVKYVDDRNSAAG